MKVLESFLISLGIKVDEKSFQKADAAFGGLTKSALQLGAVFAGKLAIDKVVGDFKKAGIELDNFQKLTGMSTDSVQALGQAIKVQGGNAADAFTDLKKIQDLMASPLTGNTGWFGDVAKLGLDPNAIIGAQDTAEALTNIAKQFEAMTPLNQKLAGNSLGLSESTVRLLMKGSEEAERQLDVRDKLAITTQKQIEDAVRLAKATSDLDLVFDDMGSTIAGELVPAFAEMAEDFTKFYRSNRELINSGLKEFFGGVADNIQLVSVAIALLGGSAALKGLATLRAIVGLGAAAAGAGAGAAAGAIAGASMLAVAGGSAAALIYSSKLNVDEADEQTNNKLKKGGTEAAGATIDFFKAKGWTEEQAMGVAANIEQESGFRHDAKGDGGHAYGLAQWHPDRQENFARFSGKSIQESSAQEQLEFINYELTQGKERAAGERLRMASSAYDAAAVVSRHYERPKDSEGEAQRRGELAQSYAGSDIARTRSSAPEVSEEELLRLTRGPRNADKPQEDFLDQTKTWLDSYRKTSQPQHQPEKQPAYDDPGAWQPIQREAPREYTVNAVVQAPPQTSAAPLPNQAAPAAQPSYTDSRVYHINGADTEKVRQVLNESMSKMTEQTMQDFRSPEQ